MDDALVQKVWHGGPTPYHVVLEAGQLARHADGLQLRALFLLYEQVYRGRLDSLRTESQTCWGYGYYVFKWDRTAWKRVSDRVDVICM
jgi:hypothetical protein